MKILTSTIPSLREARDIGHDGLGLDKKDVETELSTTLDIHLNNQGFASIMLNVQCAPREVGNE